MLRLQSGETAMQIQILKKILFRDIGPALLQTVSLNKLLRWTDRQIVSQGAKNVAKCQEKTCS